MKTPREIESLITQLADPSYAIRELASSRLSQAGPNALELLNQASTAKELEVRARCRMIVAEILQRQIEARKDKFLAGDINQLKLNVASWRDFEKLVGNSQDSRKLFVEIQRSFGTVLTTLENEQSQCSQLINKLCVENIKVIGTRNQELDRAFVGLIAFSGCQVSLESIATCRATSALRLYGKKYGYDDRLLRDLVETWVDRRSDSQPKIRILYLADEFELDQSRELARSMFAESKGLPRMAVNVLAKRGTVDDIDLIEPSIESTRTVRKVKFDEGLASVTEGDIALVACLKISQQSLKEYGFDSPDGIPAFDTSFAFRNKQHRIDAVSKWKKFREMQQATQATDNK